MAALIHASCLRVLVLVLALAGLVQSSRASATGGITYNGAIQQINPANITPAISTPIGMAVATDGTLYLVDRDNVRIVKIPPTGNASVLTITGLGTGLHQPLGLALDAFGNLYIGDDNTSNDTAQVVMVNLATGAGTALPITGVTLHTAVWLAFSPFGDLYIADGGANRIIVIPGLGNGGPILANYPATSLNFGTSGPDGVVVDPSGSWLYISDSGNNQLLQVPISYSNNVPSFGSVTRFGSGLSLPTGLAMDSFSTLYVADTNNNRLVSIDTVNPSAPQTDLSKLSNAGQFATAHPRGVAVDPMGTVYMANTGVTSSDMTSTVWQLLKVMPPGHPVSFGHGIPNTAAGTAILDFTVQSGTTPSTPNIYLQGDEISSNRFGHEFYLSNTPTSHPMTYSTYSGGGASDANFQLGFNPLNPGVRQGALELDYSPSGSIIIPLSGIGDAPVAVLDPGNPTLIAPSTTTPPSPPSPLNNPVQSALDGSGNLYVANATGNNVVMIQPDGTTTTLTSLGTLGSVAGVAVDGRGDLFVCDSTHGDILVLDPNGNVSHLSLTWPFVQNPTPLSNPGPLWLDAAGNLWIPDRGNGRIVQVTDLAISGTTSTGNAFQQHSGLSPLYSVAVDPLGSVWIANGPSQATGTTTPAVTGTNGFNGLLTTVTAPSGTWSPNLGLATDGFGNLYVADPGGNRIVRVSGSTGYSLPVSLSGMTTVLSNPAGITVNPVGDLYIADSGNNRIVQVSASGNESALTNPTASASSLVFPNTVVGATSLEEYLSVFNMGNQGLIFSAAPGYTTEFPMFQNPLDTKVITGTTTLAPGSVGYVPLGFAPSQVGSRSGTITLTDNNLSLTGATQNIAVSGLGLASPLTLSASPTTASYGQPVTFTATITFSGTAPTGTLQLEDNGVALANVSVTLPTPLTSGTGFAIVYAGLNAGTHSITVHYGGDGSNAPFTSAAVPLTVTQTTPTITLSPSTTTPPWGQPVTFTATLTNPYAGTPAPGAPTGTLQFLAAGPTLLPQGNVTLPGGTGTETATLTVAYSALVGTNGINVSYAGDANYAAATSAYVFVNPGKLTPTITLSASPTSTYYGQPVTFTATLTFTGPTPTGTLILQDLGAPLNNGSIPLPANFTSGTAFTFTYSSLVVRTHSITISYWGDNNYAGATSSPPLSQTVLALVTPTVTLSSSLNPSVAGQPVTFTATVASSAGTPTGTVQFLDNGSNLGSPVTLSGGTASLTASLGVATHSITASYTPDAASAILTSATSTSALSQVVNQATATVTLSSSPDPALAGQSVTLTATVVSGTGGTPTGTVQFLDGGTTIFGSPTLNASGTATFSAANLSAATHTLTASYQGDQNFATATSSAVSQVIDAAPAMTTPTVTLSAWPNAPYAGQTVTLTATLTPSAGYTPTGTVDFYDGATSLGSTTLLAGSTTFSTTLQTVGSHSITATYSGDSAFNGFNSTPPVTVSSPAVALTVSQDTSPVVTPTITLSASSGTSQLGQSVTLTATVSSPSGSPTGSVTFYDGATSLGGASLLSGTASFSTTSLGVSTHSITAAYQGDPEFSSVTSSAVAVAVSAAGAAQGTTVTLTASPNPPVLGQTVTYTATVTSPSGGTPTGSLTFNNTGSVDPPLGTAILYSGSATFSTSSLTSGSNAITVVFTPDSGFTGATSSPLVQNVAPVTSRTTPTVTLSASPDSPVYGQTVTFTANVNASSPYTPTGTVRFLDNGAYLGDADLNAGQATLTTDSLQAGLHNITATYAGDSAFNGFNSTPPVNVTSPAVALTVSQVTSQGNPTITLLASSPNPAQLGQWVTFIAHVSSSAGTPTGTVQFQVTDASSNTTPLGPLVNLTGGVATFRTTALSQGTHSVTAVYSGDPVFAGGTSSADAQVVGPAASPTTPNVSLGSSLNPSRFGNPVTFTATVTSTAGGTPTGTVQFMDGTTVLGNADLYAGTAALTTSRLGVGKHDITAAYLHDNVFNGATSGAVRQDVRKGAPTVTLGSSPNPSQEGQRVTFTATVASGAGAPTGSVHFLEGLTPLGTADLVSGTATFSTSNLCIGPHWITAVYQGDASFTQANSNTVRQVVAKPVITATLAVSPNPAPVQKRVTFTATVTATAGTPKGFVDFFDGRRRLLGTAPLVSGKATFITDRLAPGTYTIQAVYRGPEAFERAFSGQVVLVIQAPPKGGGQWHDDPPDQDSWRRGDPGDNRAQ